MDLLSPSHPVMLFVEKDCVCGRFLSVASLQGLIHEGTMTSLCMAVTEEQRESVVIDCSSSQPQFFNAGESQPLKQLSCGSCESCPHFCTLNKWYKLILPAKTHCKQQQF